MRGERDINKLPKWAQQKIERLENDLAYAKERLTAGPENSNTFADPYGDPRPLGEGTAIEFHLGGADDRHKRIRVRITERGWLDINGGDMLIVRPNASNSIEVKSERWSA